MPVKRRASKQLTHRITPEAVEAFSRADYATLHRLLNLLPYQYSPIDVTPGESPFVSRDSPPVHASWAVAQDLQALLVEAAEARGLPVPLE